MAVPVVIDGYNLLYARGEAPSPASRARLVRDLGRWAARRRRRAVLVFDAWAQGERVEREEVRGPVTVYFTRYGERADEWIVRWVAARPEAVVVTSDRAVRQAVGRRGAAVLDSPAFAERLEAALQPPGGDADEAAEHAEAEGAPRRRLGRHASWLRSL
ncbi:MAG: NYN domain-containing protein [Candidatus Rokubacteria bacterium]|nr:NYN domain-containing protein [Candidatus Rokubacteria bacterium]